MALSWLVAWSLAAAWGGVGEAPVIHSVALGGPVCGGPWCGRPDIGTSSPERAQAVGRAGAQPSGRRRSLRRRHDFHRARPARPLEAADLAVAQGRSSRALAACGRWRPWRSCGRGVWRSVRSRGAAVRRPGRLSGRPRRAPSAAPPSPGGRCGRAALGRPSDHWFAPAAPSRLACRTQAVWQCRPVRSLSALLPPAPCAPKARLPPASTTRCDGPPLDLSLHSIIDASWRTSCSQHNRASRSGGHRKVGLEAHRAKTGLPNLHSPKSPCPGQPKLRPNPDSNPPSSSFMARNGAVSGSPEAPAVDDEQGAL
jgi:hypothetical protein